VLKSNYAETALCCQNSVLASLGLQQDQIKVNAMEEAAHGMYRGRNE
jgi:hypothetical protein